MLRRLPKMLALVAPLALLPILSPTPSFAAGSAPVSVACSVSATIEITHFAFKPSTVVAGDTATVYLVAQNCTNRSQSTSVTWLAQYIDMSANPVATDCPVIDPYSKMADFKPFGTFKAKSSYLIPADCLATALQVTARISGAGKVLAQRSAEAKIVHKKAG